MLSYEKLGKKVLNNKNLFRMHNLRKVVAGFRKISLVKPLTTKGCCYTALVNSKNNRGDEHQKAFKLLCLA